MRFDEKVWNLMKEIPKGKVTTYKIIAEKMGSKAYRAVGNACRRNPYAPIVPCHRVVNSDGRIGGFSGQTSGDQIEKKTQILKEEGIEVKNGKVENFRKKLFRY